MSVVLKCKECGGDIQPQENGLGKCKYCGAVQTLPKDNDDTIQNLLNRANDFRLNCDFDRAIYEYEEVLKLNEAEPEAHWGLFLSKYGVEYVKDNMSFSYKPTLHRISSVSVFDDVDYKATIKYADSISVMQYKKDAENIEMVMKELLLLSTNQEPYDVFLSYKEADDITRQRTNDSYLAHDLYNELTANGYKVFFAPKSLGVGLYEPKIYAAIISAKVMIVLGTKPQYFDAVWVKNEWSRFAELIDNGEKKVIVPVYKDIEAGDLPNRLAKFQAYDLSNISFLSSLLEKISEYANNKSQVSFDKNKSAEAAYLERGFLALGDGDFTKADSFFENVLNLNPHNSEAYFGKLMVEMRVTKQEQILTSPNYLKEYANFEKAVRFANQQLKTTLLKYEQVVKDSINEQKYNFANSKISKLNPQEKDYLEASKIFDSISTYKDAEAKKKFCLQKRDEVHKDIILQTAIEKENESSGDKIALYRKAIDIYKTIPGWKDADERIKNCEKEIDNILNLEKEEKINAIKKERKKKSQKAVKIIVSILLVVSFVSAIIKIYPISVFYTSDMAILKNDGTVIGTGQYGVKGEYNITEWENIVSLKFRGSYGMFGLRRDGTVISTDLSDEVSDWTQIKAIFSSECKVYGLKTDGSIVCSGSENPVEAWTDIVEFSCYDNVYVGLKTDGTVVAMGENGYGQCNVDKWTDIVGVSTGGNYTVGLKKDGTIVACGSVPGDIEIEYWSDIKTVYTKPNYILGLKNNGTVEYAGDGKYGLDAVREWTHIVNVFVGSRHIVGLKRNGTIMYCGHKVKYECNKYKNEDIIFVDVDDWPWFREIF